MAIQRRTTATATPSRATNATANTQATQATQTTSTANQSPAGQAGPVRSASGQIINAIPVAVTGLQAVSRQPGTGSRFNRQAVFDTYTAQAGQPVTRGFIRTDATPIAGGARIQVDSFHAAKNDTMTMTLMAEVMDAKTGQMNTITLATLMDNAPVNGESYQASTHFDLKYDDVNKYLQQFNPNLKLTPGTTNLAVAAVWGTGHQAGGFARGGAFRLPASAGVAGPVGVRAAAGSAQNDPDLPLDMQVNYPPNLVRTIPNLKPDGSIQSRLESELKVTSNAKDMKGAIGKLYELVEKAQAGDTKAVESVLGKDWSIESVNRYWEKDDGSPDTADNKAGTGLFKGFRVDADGLPIQDPMHDVYMDDANLRMTRHQGAIRLRSNSAATVVNVKPGAGRKDNKTEIVQRVEVGLELKPGTDAAGAARTLQQLQTNNQFSGTVFNHAQRQVQQLDSQLVLQNALVPAFDVKQDRHKFTVVNKKTGVEVELSLDKVNVQSLRAEHRQADGKPRESEFWILEAELDHLQLASTNQSSYTAATTSGAFTNDAQQTQWLSSLGNDVTMDIDPRLHELDDLENESFRTSADYKAFEGVIGRVLPKLFPNGTDPAVQKAAQAAEMMGLVFFDDSKVLDGAKSAVQDAGFKWTAPVKAAFEAAVADPSKRIDIETAFGNGTTKNIANFVQLAGVPPNDLEYNVSALKRRVAGALEGIGLKDTPEIRKMLDGADAKRLPPQNLDSFLTRLPSYQDAQAMQQIAQALGVNPPPVPAQNPEALFGDKSTVGSQMRTKLEAAQVAPGQADAIEDLLREVAKAGAGAFEIRTAMNAMQSNPQQRIDQLAQKYGLTTKIELRANLDSMVKLVEPRFGQYFQSVTPDIRAFFQQVVDSRPLPQAQQFFALFARGVPEQLIAQEAKKMSVPAPKTEYDWSLIDSTLQPTLSNAQVAYDAGLKAFAREVIEAGVPVGTLNQAFAQVGTTGDLKASLKQRNIFIVGTQIPDITFDAAALTQTLTTQLARYAPFLDARRMGTFAKSLLDAGMTPAQASTYATTALQRNKKTADAGIQPNVDASKVPDLPTSRTMILNAMKPSLGTVTAPQEAYIKDALDEGLKDGTLALHALLNANVATVIARLQQQTGLARPQGV